MKAKNIIGTKLVGVKVVNWEYNEDCVEVVITEGNFEGKYAVVKKVDLVPPATPQKKERASLEFRKYVDDSNEHREVVERSVDVYVTTDKEEVLENILDKFERIAKEDYDFDVEFFRCDWEDGERFSDGFTLEFEYGEMTEKKKAIKAIWKDVKRSLNLR